MQPHRISLSRIAALTLAAALMLVAAACANIGTPEGGPRDYTPPRVVKTSPANGAVNFKGNKVEITFDEIVQIKDQQSKVVVSPAQKEMPVIRNTGRKVTVEFRDTLKPNTTYVVDFTNAIEDNNEGNVLDGYSFAFSTGETIDSLQVSGMALRASDLEPMQHILVGLHSNLSDTAFATTPLERISRTNDRGQFTLRNLKPGRYHIFALNDVDGDYRMARTEDMAFCDSVIVPGVNSVSTRDTVFTFDHRVDTVVTATHTQYVPNNVLLSVFNENYRQQYIKSHRRLGRNRLLLQMGAPQTRMPQVRLLSPQPSARHWCRLERNERGDSLVYWLADSSLIKSDSLSLEVHYMRTPTDGADTLVEATDTLAFAAVRSGYELKQQEQARKEREKRQKEISQLVEKRDKAAAEGKDVTEYELNLAALRHQDEAEVPSLKATLEKAELGVTDSIAFKFDTPVDTVYNRRLRLTHMLPDSTWEAVPLPPMVKANECSELRYVLPMRLQPGGQYKLQVDSAAIYSIYNLTCKGIDQDISVKKLEDYANLYMRIQGLAGRRAVAQLLDGGDKPVMTAAVDSAAAEAAFENVEPGTYYVRLFIDDNGNGVWDTGNYVRHQQPEEVYYYPKPLKLRRNWDVDQAWNIYAAPLDLQKPENIRKNRPENRTSLLDSKRKRANKADGDTEEDDTDGFSNPAFGRNAYSGNKYNDYRNGQR